MNEVELIRNQLALERTHAGAVANACASAMQGDETAGDTHESLGQFRRACVDYLACVLAWFEERDQRLTDLLQARFHATDPARRSLDEVLARPGRSRDVLTKLEAACTGASASTSTTTASGSAGRRQVWREFAEYFNAVWSTRRDALDALLSTNSRATDWRTLGGIDADSMLEERRRYAQARSQAPPGVALGTDPR